MIIIAPVRQGCKVGYNASIVPERTVFFKSLLSLIDMADVNLEIRDKTAILTLARPEALNSLNAYMVARLRLHLESIAKDHIIKAVLIKGAGDRAFCAGGDIKAAREGAIALREGHLNKESVTAFFDEEYGMNQYLYHYVKPTLSLMNGITMGGGVGVAGACTYRIATEKTVWAMPEVNIGFFPDVGAAYHLSRAPDHIGRYLAMTGAALTNAQDILYAGFATHFVPEANLPNVIDKISAGDDIMQTLDKHALQPLQPVSLPLDIIRACFKSADARQIVENLARDGTDWAHETRKLILQKSPTSVSAALHHVIMAEREDFDTVIARDMKLAIKFLGADDFIEGVRAAVVDKDKSPKWNPSSLEQVGKDRIDEIFN